MEIRVSFWICNFEIFFRLSMLSELLDIWVWSLRERFRL